MKVVALNRAATTESACAVLDHMKARLLSGESVGFLAVELGPDDCTYISSSFTRVTSNLKARGMADSMLEGIRAGAIDKEGT